MNAFYEEENGSRVSEAIYKPVKLRFLCSAPQQCKIHTYIQCAGSFPPKERLRNVDWNTVGL